MRPPKLLDQVRDAIQLRHYSIRTEEAYIQWIKRFIYFHNKKHPNHIGENGVEAFLSRLAVDSMSQLPRKIKHSCQLYM